MKTAKTIAKSLLNQITPDDVLPPAVNQDREVNDLFDSKVERLVPLIAAVTRNLRNKGQKGTVSFDCDVDTGSTHAPTISEILKMKE